MGSTDSGTTNLVASSSLASDRAPFLTVAIPHYKYRHYLEVVLESLLAQTYRDFEILISDDCSPDDSNTVIPQLLSKANQAFRYYAQPTNLGYDGNVRFCLRLARGRYVLLLGNDDALRGDNALAEIVELLHQTNLPEVAFTNYEDWASGEVTRRALRTTDLGSGSAVAVANFRSFSFVSGLIYDRASAAAHETDRWDTSIYYQIYLACRILAAGGRLAALNLSAVRKDVQVDAHTVTTYASKWANEPWSFQPRHTGLDSVIRVTADAILPLLPESERSATLARIVAKVFASTYPFWLFEYRRVANWSFSAGIARELWPHRLLREYKLSLHHRLYLWTLYIFATVGGLLTPVRFLELMRPRLAEFFRREQQLGPAAVNS